MSTFAAFSLGLLQGFTELLPISSSGHLVAAERFFAIGIPDRLQSFDILLHAGTLLALLLCYPQQWYALLSAPFRGDRIQGKLLLLLVVGTIPAGAAGFLFSDVIEQYLRSPLWVAGGFAITAIVLLLVERVPERRGAAALGWMDAFLIGCAQAVALVPSISRSGLAAGAGRALGLKRGDAVDFSFLLAVPVIAGATLITLKDAMAGSFLLPSFSIVFTGVLSSFGSSILAILFLRRFVTSHSLAWFSLYLLPLSLLLVVL
ncbi:MAG: undecaprenyl-diphosphate phosphatase [Candidatus Peribacteraceae bacterium]|nr:undecaprenyl-diphosphate phosphatase [Candidatus Peribacteraceae bacterium]